MLRKMLAIFLTALLLFPLLLPVAAQSDDPLSIAILRFGPNDAIEITEGGILDVMEAYDFITAAENRALEERQNLEGDKISIHFGDAGFDLATANLVVEAAMDLQPDVLVALHTPIAQIAVASAAEMDYPPVVLFVATAPFKAGLASSSCIKPDYVGGSETLVEFEPVFAALRLQDPDLQRIGFIYSSTMLAGEGSRDRITAIAAEMDIEVLEAGITTLADVSAATEGLVERGAEALLASGDSLLSAGLPIIVAAANENALPVFHPSMGSISVGVTIAAGFSSYYSRGINLGVILVGHLNGDIDIASTAIHIDSSNLLGINMDSAAEQDVVISEQLLDEADTVYSGGRIAQAAPAVLQAIARRGKIVPMEQRHESDQAFLASLQCTDEMIAEQQAALDAAE